ncbi:hypothetical protein N7462_009818 [Penicillium macrosclerotiorum]|uniref:uncharacterized protein n=1 Tax=Penicillium macrosclerotiorum TaxID=303699 RepID=UPI002547E4EF|nr:uncharacterized protein N7462_009818 [Penicillium macrosclerotiorum]KAJ5668748.1 hypothetical protein N7462_009818 [Penicillium macrosclerotiorum]
MPAFKKGDKVNYKPVGGPASHTNTSVGVICDLSTTRANFSGRIVQASEEEPRYEVENQRTRKKSAIKESNILGPAE